MLKAQKNTLRIELLWMELTREWVTLPRGIGRVTYEVGRKNEQIYPFKRGVAIYLPLF
jgi:hypothetical protein